MDANPLVSFLPLVLLALFIWAISRSINKIASKDTSISQNKNCMSPRFFGRMGVADFFMVLLGGGAFSNIAMMMTRNPQAIAYLGSIAMILGAVTTRYIMVALVRYINLNFGENDKRSVLVKIGYLICFVILVAAFVLSKIALDEHIRG